MKKMVLGIILLVTIQSSDAFQFLNMLKEYRVKKQNETLYKSLFAQKNNEEKKNKDLIKKKNDYVGEKVNGQEKLNDLKSQSFSYNRDFSNWTIVELKKEISDCKFKKENKIDDNCYCLNALCYLEETLKIKLAQAQIEDCEKALRICNANITRLNNELTELRNQLGNEVATALEKEFSESNESVESKGLLSRIYGLFRFLPKIQNIRFNPFAYFSRKPVMQQ